MRNTDLPIACDLSVLSDQQRERLASLARHRITQVTTLRELPDGYALGFDAASVELMADLAEFMALDRLCCPFLRHALITEPGSEGVRLELTGGPGAKAAIAGDLLGLVADGVRFEDS